MKNKKPNKKVSKKKTAKKKVTKNSQPKEQFVIHKMSTPTPDTQVALLEPITASSTVKEGTAQVEPQFVVLRHGQKFVTATNYKELHKGLIQAEELEEQNVEIDFQLEGYPLDCIVQVNKAINIAYGFSHAKDRMTFFGPIPPQRLNIMTSLTESVQVVYGEMAPPAWEGGSINMYVDVRNPLTLQISGHIKRKFEPEIKKVVDLAKELIKKESIYRGNAVELDLSYVMAPSGDKMKMFEPARCAPKFLEINKQQNLILPRDIEFELETNVWNIMRNPENFRENNIPIKSGVLLDGPPGTGKTLTAYKTAQTAVESNWTYVYLRVPLTPDTFLVGYRLAQLYGPSVFFVEDCDVLFGKTRDEDMNRLLETLDGITAKNAEVITIFTTNFPDTLNDAFTRSGRVSHQISFRAPDAEAAGRFVESIASNFLEEDADMEAIGKAFANLVPADITNGIDQAKKFCVGKNGKNIIGKVTTEMLTDAAAVVQRKAKRGGKDEHPDTVTVRKIRTGVGELLGARN